MIIKFVYRNTAKLLKVFAYNGDILNYDDFVFCAQTGFSICEAIWFCDKNKTNIGSDILLEYVIQYQSDVNFELHIQTENLIHLAAEDPNHYNKIPCSPLQEQPKNLPDGSSTISVTSSDTSHSDKPELGYNMSREPLHRLTSEKLGTYIRGQEYGDYIFHSYNTNNLLSSKERNAFKRLVCQHIILTCGYYPTAAEYTFYARLCIQLLPAYKNMKSENEWDLFYDPDSYSGWLHDRMKYCQNLKRKFTKKTKNGKDLIKQSDIMASVDEKPVIEEFDNPDNDNDISFLQSACASTQKLNIIEKFKNTFKYRSANIKNILKDFPIIKALPELILIDFDLIADQKHFDVPSSLKEVFRNYGSKIDVVFEKNIKPSNEAVKLKIQEWSLDIQVYLKLLSLLPSVNTKERSKKFSTLDAVEKLIVFCPLTSPEAEIASQCTCQPQFIAFGANKKAISYFGTKVDDTILLFPKCITCIDDAMDFFFKLHFVFQIHYDPAHVQFFNFIQDTFYKIPGAHITHGMKSLKVLINI